MKTFIRKSIYAATLLIFLLSFTGCPGIKSKDPDPSATAVTLTDANEISKVMVIADATLEKGNPPAENNVASAPTITAPTPEVSGISGQDIYLTFNYSNATANITYILIQLDGASSYFKIPIKQSTGRSGTINIPVKIPENSIIPTCKQGGYEAFFLMANGPCKKVGGQKKCFSSILKPKPGKGTAVVNGRSFDATAVCGLNFAPFGTGYAIQIGQSQFIIFYNMSNGGNSLGNFNDLVGNSLDDFPKTPFAMYFDGTTIYTSVSGVASVNGKVVSTTLTVEELLNEGNRITVSASGNCQ